MRIALIHHPQARARRVRRAMALAQVLDQRGHAVTVHDSATFRFTRDRPDADLLCICGGDGTVRLVLDGQGDLAGLPPLAIHPSGTINLLARELGYPADPQAFARRIENTTQPRTVTIARAGTQRFLACASTGFDAQVVATVSSELKAKIGRFAYVAALLAMLWRWPRHVMQVTADGERFMAEAVFVLRGALYAGPWTLDRRAGLACNTLHMLAMPRARRRDFAALAFYALGGARHPRPDWRLAPVSSLEIESDRPCFLQLDGDAAGATPVTIRITNEAIKWL